MQKLLHKFLQKLYQLMLPNRKATGNMRMPGINPYLIAAALWLAPLPVSAQGMLDLVDMTSPEMAEAEMSRAQLEALLADASRDRPADLTRRRFSGLDLSGIDFKGADLRWSRFNYADLEGADLSDARLDLTWFYKADLDGANLSRSHLFSAQLQHASLEDADISGARVVANF
ncbi:MAG TPA: pentapeptide repeat-containing protein, partial [Arenicellales bacterium]|nr:pentapeptide repeat-containing protein [Arenicellales bacterium]